MTVRLCSLATLQSCSCATCWWECLSNKLKKRKKTSKYVCGPFSSVFTGSMARVLDQSIYLGKLEFTISILVEATGLTYKTVESCLERLQKINWINSTRRIGNAQAYAFDTNHMGNLIKWGREFQCAIND